MPLPAPRRWWSSGSQPNSYIIGARKRDGSATRPVTTICAPAFNASTIGSAPRYTSAETRSAFSVEVGCPFSRMVSVRSSTRSVMSDPFTDATFTPLAPFSRSQCTMRCAAASGLIQPWLVMIFVPRFKHPGNTPLMRASR